MKKNVWKKPKLVVLVRGKPEETLLIVCKRPAGHFGPGGNECGIEQPPPPLCESLSSS